MCFLSLNLENCWFIFSPERIQGGKHQFFPGNPQKSQNLCISATNPQILGRFKVCIHKINRFGPEICRFWVDFSQKYADFDRFKVRMCKNHKKHISHSTVKITTSKQGFHQYPWISWFLYYVHNWLLSRPYDLILSLCTQLTPFKTIWPDFYCVPKLLLSRPYDLTLSLCTQLTPFKTIWPNFIIVYPIDSFQDHMTFFLHCVPKLLLSRPYDLIFCIVYTIDSFQDHMTSFLYCVPKLLLSRPYDLILSLCTQLTPFKTIWPDFCIVYTIDSFQDHMTWFWIVYPNYCFQEHLTWSLYCVPNWLLCLGTNKEELCLWCWLSLYCLCCVRYKQVCSTGECTSAGVYVGWARMSA